jgi:hypothetical protein
MLCVAAPSAQRGRRTLPTPAPVTTKKTAQAVPFAAGETLDYDVSWSSYVTAGTATLKVVEKKPSYGSDAYYIVAEGRPTPLVSKLYDLYYKADTLLDVYSLLPQRSSIYSEEGKRHRTKATIFDQAAKKAHYEVQTRTVIKNDLAIPPSTQDALSAIYVLRAIALKQGDSFVMPVLDNGEIYNVQMQVDGVEAVKTYLGEMRAWKITPRLPSANSSGARRLTLWLSDDARRLPVRLQAQLAVGSFDVTLKSATR